MLVAMASIPAVGCFGTGARSIRTGRGNYNVAIQQTNAQQLLLNVVRLRYMDTPAFLNVSSVSTSLTLAVDAGGGVAELENLGVVGISGGLSYAERPTITYSPLQGQQFVSLLMSPMSLRVPLLLYHSGWRIDRVLRVCLQSIGELRNAPSGASPTPALAPEYKRFARVAEILRDLQSRGFIELGQAGAEEDSLVLQIDTLALERSGDRLLADELADELDVPRGTQRITLARGATDASDALAVVTRSVMGTMYFLSLGVEPPLRDQQAGRVVVTHDKDGKVFDWGPVTKDLLKIRSSEDRPNDAYTGVSYRDSWFFIEDDDIHAKSTFTLLAQLMVLQAGDVELKTPVLTLPLR